MGHVDHTGETYEGELSSGVRHGRGTCIYTNNHMYEGLWSNGKEHGYGMLTDRHDAIVYEGEFAEGKIHGKGTVHFVNGSEYKGEFREGKRWGLGLYTSKEGPEKGVMYNGEWRDNICSGKGYWKDEKGNSYDGDWDQNMRHGLGVHYCSNGYIYDGQWKSNVPEGRGIAIYPVRLYFFVFCFFFLKQIILLFTDVVFVLFLFSFLFTLCMFRMGASLRVCSRQDEERVEGHTLLPMDQCTREDFVMIRLMAWVLSICQMQCSCQRIQSNQKATKMMKITK